QAGRDGAEGRPGRGRSRGRGGGAERQQRVRAGHRAGPEAGGPPEPHRGAHRRGGRRAGAVRPLLPPPPPPPPPLAHHPPPPPVPGDPIGGFIPRNQGVTVHTVGCPRAPATDPERRVDVAWDVRGDVKRPVTLRVLTADRPGLLADMSNIFSKKGVNISQANCRATGDDRAVNTFEVTISDLKQLTDLMKTIERLNGVYSVERV